VLGANGKATTKTIYLGIAKARIVEKKSTIILRKDKGICWSLIPKDKIYFESKMTVSGFKGTIGIYPIPGLSVSTISKMASGKEKVNGYWCYKTIVKGFTEGHAYSITRWYSEKLGVYVKQETRNANGKATSLIELKNIIEKKLPNRLFELPKGYTKVPDGGLYRTRHL
jgi:hypothetical protein